MMLLRAAALGLAAASLWAGGCARDAAAPAQRPTVLEAVSPTGGSTGVSVGATVTIDFDHPVMTGMQAYAALHEGDVTGPVVAGTWSLPGTGKQLVFAPAQPLKPATTYTIHLGGGMMGADGRPVNFSQNQQRCGGQWATAGMMGSGSGMMGGSSGMMGPGWQGANGTYGMIFQFTTA